MIFWVLDLVRLDCGGCLASPFGSLLVSRIPLTAATVLLVLARRKVRTPIVLHCQVGLWHCWLPTSLPDPDLRLHWILGRLHWSSPRLIGVLVLACSFKRVMDCHHHRWISLGFLSSRFNIGLQCELVGPQMTSTDVRCDRCYWPSQQRPKQNKPGPLWRFEVCYTVLSFFRISK